MSVPPPARDARIDWLRGVAALLVLVHHLFAPVNWTALPLLHALSQAAAWFYLGVPVFFVLSGRCVAVPWLKGIRAGTFLSHRLRRVYPPYLASLLVCLGAALVRVLVLGVNDTTEFPSRPLEILATVLLLTEPATKILTVNWVYWSLSFELAFYGILAALLLLPKPRARLAGWLLLHGLFCAADLFGLNQAATPAFFVGNWPLFGLGVGLALLRASPPWGVATFAISGLHLVSLAFVGLLDLRHGVGLLTVGLLLLPRSWWSPAPDQLLPRVGVWSYSLYLIHVPLGVHLFLRPLLGTHAHDPLRAAFALTVATAASIFSALLFHRFIERPWMSPPARVSP